MRCKLEVSGNRGLNLNDKTINNLGHLSICTPGRTWVINTRGCIMYASNIRIVNKQQKYVVIHGG